MVKTDLKGKRAVVTAAGSEMGLNICLALVSCGAEVIACDESEFLAGRTAIISGGYSKHLDMSSKEDIYSVSDDIFKEFGKVDILVNCGVNMLKERALIHELDFDEYLNVANKSVNGTYYICKAFSSHMQKNGGGIIINFASMLGLVPRKGCVANAASSAAIMSLTRVWALEMCDKNVRFHTIALGLEHDVSDEKTIEHQASKKPATPEDAANAVLFLSDGSSTMENGCILTVDGGLHYGYMRNF